MRTEMSCLTSIILVILLNTVAWGYEFNISAVKNIVLKYPDLKEILTKFHKEDVKSGELRPLPKESILDLFRKDPTEKITSLHPAFGAFFNMIVNICEAILTKFKTRMIPRYFKVLGNSLRGLGSGTFIRGIVKDFSKKLTRLSAYKGSVLRMYVIAYLDVITNEETMMLKFFHAMNALYNPRDDTLMDDYVYFVTMYGKGSRGPIKTRTNKFLKDLMFRRLRQQDYKVRDDIVKKFKAVCDDFYF